MGRELVRSVALVGLLSGGLPVLAEPPTRTALHTRQEISVADGPVTDAGVQAWIAAFRPRALAAGISEATLDAALTGVALRPDVVVKDRNQTEFTRTIWDYLDKAVSQDRIAAGQKALKMYGPVLRRIEAKYGVDRQVLLAIWGLESSYGVQRGDVPTVAALVTLASSTRRSAASNSRSK
jgi:membrane-bound lytic murein transglycosylase B